MEVELHSVPADMAGQVNQWWNLRIKKWDRSQQYSQCQEPASLPPAPHLALVFNLHMPHASCDGAAVNYSLLTIFPLPV